jgi:mono/diheme cytochrome c family protein
MHVFKRFFSFGVAGVVYSQVAFGAGAGKVDFNRDIRPIFSDNCYTCHGPDAGKRKAGLRLDRQDDALAELKSGDHAIVPGDISKSALIARITSKDEDERMPPLKTGKHLTAEQIELLTKWIAQGAEWKKHWSFIAPERPDLPSVTNKRWPRNPIDEFILARLDREHLAPSREADKATLIRRVTFDLTGLPPTPPEVDAFLADSRADAYERLVDRLLASPRYGEHEARYWLDAARYGDTHGLHLDNERSLWPYRDWVINAFNKNMPFNEFTIEQLAGDLLPSPTLDQKVATGFNRCNVSTSEGGAIDEEFYVRYAVDRTETMATVWMGLTAGCAVCHDHKFDPISQKEFYQLYAFFNNVNEKAMDGNALLPPPILKVPSTDQKSKLKELNDKIGPTEKKMYEEAAKIKYVEPKRPKMGTNAMDFVWVEDDFPKGAKGEINGGTAERKWVTNQSKVSGLESKLANTESKVLNPVFSGERALVRTDKGLAQDFFTGASQPLLVGKGDSLFAYVYLDPANPPKAIMLQYHTTEWLNRANWGDEDAIPYGAKGTSQKVLMGALPATGKWVRLEVEVSKLGLAAGAKIDGLAFTEFGGTVYWDKAGILTATPQEDLAGVSMLAWEAQEKAKTPSMLPRDILETIKLRPKQRTAAQTKAMTEYYIANIYEPEKATFEPFLKQIADVKKERDALDNSVAATMVMQDMEKPRGAFVLKRGQYDQRGDQVQPALPAILPPLPPGAPTNRLEFAKWLVSPEQPLTARVIVNRFWQQFFGTGLVKTASDFGSQGEWPSHPELLDWLACEFEAPSTNIQAPDKDQSPNNKVQTAGNRGMSEKNNQSLLTSSRTGWDVKHLVRLIVTSAAYRQDAKVTPRLHEADPDNRLLARGPRFRLDAEEIRDEALYVSGLLVEKLGGKSVRPYQPEGIWEAVGYTASNTAKFTQDHGEALYRRSLYTFWKRTAPPPSLITFDAPSREKYCVRRERTDTPLQALVVMNDPQYVEAARHFGERLIQHSCDVEQRLDFGFRTVTARHPSRAEKAVLERALEKFEAKYEKDPEAAKKLIAVGESPAPEGEKPAELAAYTMVASLLLNLDEVLNN